MKRWGLTASVRRCILSVPDSPSLKIMTVIINGPSEMFGPTETPEIKASGLKREYDKYEPTVW